MRFSKVTIINLRKPEQGSVNDELKWIGASVGLFNERDKNRSCFRLFITLLKHVQDEGLSSDDLAEQLGLSRGTVVHHLRRLMEAGLVDVQGKRYILKVDSLEVLIKRLRNNVNDTLTELETVAKHLDMLLGMK